MLSRLVARDFRNFESLDITIPDSGIAIIGENGQGKTNLLEAVAYLSLLRSLRGARDPDVVRFGAPVFHVRAELVSLPGAPVPYHAVSVGYERATKRKRATLDGVEQPRLTSALGSVPSVCFSPADTVLVAGGPSARRHYLDVALALSSVPYLQALQHYRAALLRRNAALRLAQREGPRGAAAHVDRVCVWEPALAQYGSVVTSIRRSYVERHAERFSAIAASIGEQATVSMRYVSSTATGSANAGANAGANVGAVDADPSALLAAYESGRTLEMRRGTTLVGPHRDELQLLLGGRELRVFGSAGQQRSAAIALRLLELASRREAVGTSPLLLLDDPFAELDARRAARVLALLEEAGIGQTLLAVPRVEDIPAAFTRLERRYMRAGQLTSATPA
ncbi:MAG: DNA replication and repair protein RecF [Gemmatimonadota bacterium]